MVKIVKNVDYVLVSIKSVSPNLGVFKISYKITPEKSVNLF